MTDARKRVGIAVGGITLGAVGITLIVLFVAALGALIWWLGVQTSGTAGAGNVTKDRNSSQNIEHWSTTFNGEYQKIQGDVASLGTLKAAETAPGATQQDRINYTGAVTVCQQDVAEYNADTQNTLAVVPAGLPSSIHLTTCGE